MKADYSLVKDFRDFSDFDALCTDFISAFQINIMAGHGLEMRFAASPFKDLCNNDKSNGWIHQAHTKHYVTGCIFAAEKCTISSYLEQNI